MLAVGPLREQFARLREQAPASGDLLRSAFCKLPFSVARELLAAGLHPRSVPRHWVPELLRALPEKLYLVRPRHMQLQDLLVVLERHSNLELYAAHLEYFKHELLRAADAFLLARCVPYLTLFDDDVRYLVDVFGAAAGSLLARANARSMYRMSYHFSEDLAEEMLLADARMHEPLYDHQPFTPAFLRRMFFTHGVVPANAGLRDEPSSQLAVAVLAGVACPRAAMRFLMALHRRVLRSAGLRDFVLISIINGQRLEHWLWYARHYLRAKAEAMHVYAPIYFDDVHVPLAQHTLTRERLQNICRFAERYARDMPALARTLLAGEHFDLLAQVLAYAPADVLSESVCLRVVRAAAVPVRAAHLLHSECVLLQCHERGYTDLVDFLDSLDVATLERNGVMPFSEYCFRSEWFNREPELLAMFVRYFGFCGAMMRRLLFEYPLAPDATACVLELMAGNPGMSLFEPTRMCSLRYLLCTTRRLRVRPLRGCVTLPRERTLRADGERRHFGSEADYDMLVALQIYCCEQLRSCAVRDLAFTRTREGVCLQFRTRARARGGELARLAAQMYDLALLAHRGLFCLPTEYLPRWLPVFDLLAGNELRAPARVEGDTLAPLEPADFVRYEDLGDAATAAYALREPAGSYHAALNALMGTLLAYLVLGSARVVPSEDAVPALVAALLRALRRGLKINERLEDTPLEVHAELVALRRAAASSCGGVTIPEPRALQSTLRLCEHACVAIILENNHSNKFSA
ncbi:MC032 [Molluscum contagiosum virus subtype 1]|uniref:MC032L n=3 Tax=Molluscum contagiosum virus TaxID=10279 RepID=A0A858A3S5_9POXV|nr:MC032 [Molluscum contagiosum virus subtype 1]AYO88347.1 MC032 [Molluscum contagiosum virus subtype 1]AYO88523.1 MC032 [Molluscum contagiosum virus subtype 1]QHW17834.1 MC032L [Molluscum contagiosum virus]QHW18013.1 MC032L [Molluscum contagiosum virus]